MTSQARIFDTCFPLRESLEYPYFLGGTGIFVRT